MTRFSQLLTTGIALFMVLALAIPAQAILVGHWAMDEAAWTGVAGQVIDSSPTGNNGQSFGDAATIAGGRLGRAGDFDGSGDRVQIPDNATHNLQSDGTISAWARFDALPASTHTIVAAQSYSTGFLFNQIGDRLSAYYRSGGPSISTAAGFFSTGQWYHMAMTNNSGTLNLFVNGALVGTNSEGGNAFTQQAFQIGGGQFASIDGNVDDFGVWSDGLSTGRVRSLYTVPEDLGLNYNVSTMAALWDTFDDQGIIKIGGTRWAYVNSLPGSPNVGDAYIENGLMHIALTANAGLAEVAIPEPSSFLLLGLGTVLLARRTRRRSRRRA